MCVVFFCFEFKMVLGYVIREWGQYKSKNKGKNLLLYKNYEAPS